MIFVYVTVIALVISSALCVFASFAERFEDNSLQRIGLAFIGFTSGVKAMLVLGNGYVEAVEAICYLGVCLFAVGTLLNPRHFCKKEKVKCSQQLKGTRRQELF